MPPNVWRGARRGERHAVPRSGDGVTMVATSWINILLGAWLTLAPLSLAFPRPAASNSMLFGMIVLALAGASLFVRPRNHLPAWLNLVAGVWVFVSPWALGFAGQPNAMWTHVIAGGSIVIVALIRIGARGRVPASSRL